MGIILGIIAIALTAASFVDGWGFLDWFATPVALLFFVAAALLKSFWGKLLTLVALGVAVIKILVQSGIF